MSSSTHHKPVSVTSQCMAIVLSRVDGREGTSGRSHNGHKIFLDMQEENRGCFWNPGLVESVSSLEFVGFMKPGTLLVSGNELHLECLRGAWARRVLKPPRGYCIKSLGDIGGIEMQAVPQTHFISLPEALCLITSTMNRAGQPATLDSITLALRDQYAGMTIPSPELLYGTLAALTTEGKVYCMGEHYFVSTPLMYQHYQAVNQKQRPMVAPTTTNNVPPNPYHQKWSSRPNNNRMQDLCSRECQTGASIVNAPAFKPKRDQATSVKENQTSRDQQTQETNNNEHQQKAPLKTARNDNNKEKPGFFKKFFRRSKSREPKGKKESTDSKPQPPQASLPRGGVDSRSSSASGSQQRVGPTSAEVPPPSLTTFSAQFPPTEWLPNPRFVGQQHPTQQGLFFKHRRSRDKQNAVSKDRNSVWVDLDPSMKDCRRSKNDNWFNSQRYSTFPENLNAKTGGQYSPKVERRKPKQRLSKYMSSSSECLHCVVPTIQEIPHPRRSKTERRHGREQRNYRDYGGQEGENLGKFHVSEPYKEPLTPTQQPTTPRMEQGVFSKPPAPLAQPTDVDLSTTATTGNELDMEENRVTPPPTTEVALRSDKREGGGKTETGRRTSDSALSASPVVTEMSSASSGGSSNKYSSWSGSEGKQPEHLHLRDRQRNPPRDPNDHTYINLNHPNEQPSQIPEESYGEVMGREPLPSPIAMDPTYENIALHLESTHFENMTMEPDFHDDSRNNNNKNGFLGNQELRVSAEIVTQTITDKEKVSPTYISNV